jgi:rubrerythrin
MTGGMSAWRGITAQGFPEALISFFPLEQPVEETIGIAWLLEEGTRRFYEAVSVMLDDHETTDVFLDLASAEEKHEALLLELYNKLSGKGAQSGDLFLSTPIEDGPVHFLEGGVSLEEALTWLSAKRAKDILEFSIALETNAYDRYLTMASKARLEDSKHVFKLLSRKEKEHLTWLTEVFARMI